MIVLSAVGLFLVQERLPACGHRALRSSMPDLIAVGCKCDDAVVSARAACLLDELDSVIEGIGLCSPCIALDTDEPVLGKQDHFHGRTLAGIRGCTKRSLNLICLHERHYDTALCSFYGKDDLLAGKGLVRRIALFCWNQRIRGSAGIHVKPSRNDPKSMIPLGLWWHRSSRGQSSAENPACSHQTG